MADDSDLTPADLERTLDLLRHEFGDPRFETSRFLEWQYLENPCGNAIQTNFDDEGRRVAHYAIYPTAYRNAEGPALFGLSINSATLPEARKAGHFVTLARQTFEKGAVAGIVGGYGVPNENATPPALKYLGANLIGQLPVRVSAPRRARASGESFEVTPDFLDSATFEELARDLDSFPADKWTQQWTVEALRWRLSNPATSYALHADERLVAITTTTSNFGVRAAVLLKLLPRHGRAGPHSAREITAQACRFHETRVAVYAGFNANVEIQGVDPPKRLRPAPLNLVNVSFTPSHPLDSFEPDTFEFLDFDAF